MENNWLDKHSRASMKLSDIALEIEDLAKGFRMTGNTAMHVTLTCIAEELEGADREMRDAIGESLAEMIDRSGKNIETVLKASLVGALIAGKDR